MNSRLSILRNIPKTRLYATATSAKQLTVNLSLPHQSILKDFVANQVNLSSSDGDMGILADHVPSIAQLNPGVIEVLSKDKTDKYFVSGGFATMNPDSSLNINAVEAFSLNDIDFDAARKALGEAEKKLTSTGATPQEIATAKIEIEVLTAVNAASKSAK